VISTEIAYASDVIITNSANPGNMLLSGFGENYSVFPLPTNHVISGNIDLSSYRRRRQIDYSLAGDATYYGALGTTTAPLLYVRTNVQSALATGAYIG
jgi:hypothetical protein